MVGSKESGIGISYDASWIAARACSVSCSSSALLRSAEFLLCPTRLDGTRAECEKRPHIINNSWGGGNNDPWFNDVINAWINAGIVPVFAIGNSGPGCNTANSPGDYINVLSVGATDINDKIAYFSSRGSVVGTNIIKPDISAPGVNIRSAWIGQTNSYNSISGTSMATPHVSGIIGLYLESDESLRYDYNRLKEILYTSSYKRLGEPEGEQSCGNTRYDVYPNNYYGYGRLSA
jgi:subtilisin family serine protease